MSSHKTLAVIGASEETVAHLRLLMKLGSNQLDHQWTWGSEEAADFVAVEVHDLGCQGVVARCQSAGVPCAVMAEANEPVVHGLVLRRPFKLEQIIAVLNAAGAASAESGPVEAFSDDFYTRDLEDYADRPQASSEPEDLWTRRENSHAHMATGHDPDAAGLDRLIHGDPLAEPEKRKPLIAPGTTVERSSGTPTRRSEGRADQSRHRVIPEGVVGVGTVDVAPIVLPSRNEERAGVTPQPYSMPAGTAWTSVPTTAEAASAAGRSEAGRSEAGDAPLGHPLSEYLEGNLLLSPSLLQLPDRPALTLDPKKRAYHAEGDLAALAPYAQGPLPRGLSRGLSTAELNRVRAEQPARTYDELRWLIALLQSGGRLSGKLDPGGSYQVERPVQVAADFHAHGAIAHALATPARLHEIVASTGASMEQVFDMVNAYDAIGRLRWTPRQRLAAQAPAETKPAGGKSGFKWPFGKR
jgi:hypothetical protein